MSVITTGPDLVLDQETPVKPTVELIDTDLLQIDHRYQRTLDEERITRWIAAGGLDWVKFQVLTGNLRQDGRVYIINGQHRLALARRQSISPVPVLLVVGDEPPHEAGLFVDLNTGDRKVAGAQVYTAKLFAGDQRIAAIDAVLKEAGFFVAAAGTAFHDFHAISAIGAVEKIYDLNGAIGLRETLRAVDHAWHNRNEVPMNQLRGHARSIRGQTLRGLHWLFYHHVPYDVSWIAVVNVLKSIGQDQLLLRAQQRQQQINRGDSIYDAVYRTMIDEINHSRAKKLLYVPMRGRPPLSAEDREAILKKWHRGEPIANIARFHRRGAGEIADLVGADRPIQVFDAEGKPKE